MVPGECCLGTDRSLDLVTSIRVIQDPRHWGLSRRVDSNVRIDRERQVRGRRRQDLLGRSERSTCRTLQNGEIVVVGLVVHVVSACDIDLGASVIRAERGWDAVEGAIEPKSPASRRVVPLLAVLRDFLDQHKLATEREGEALVLGRTSTDPFAPMTISKRQAWKAAELGPITLHEGRHCFASLLIDSGGEPEGGAGVHGSLEDSDHLRWHLFPWSRDEVRERMDAYLGAAAGVPAKV